MKNVKKTPDKQYENRSRVWDIPWLCEVRWEVPDMHLEINSMQNLQIPVEVGLNAGNSLTMNEFVSDEPIHASI